MAPGLRGKVVVEFTGKEAGLLTALISIESSDQLCEIPVIGNISDGFEKFNEILASLSASASGQSKTRLELNSQPSDLDNNEVDNHSLLSSLKYSQRLEKEEKELNRRLNKASVNKHNIQTTVSQEGGWFGEKAPSESLSPKLTGKASPTRGIQVK
jgi:hypothetical protein